MEKRDKTEHGEYSSPLVAGEAFLERGSRWIYQNLIQNISEWARCESFASSRVRDSTLKCPFFGRIERGMGVKSRKSRNGEYVLSSSRVRRSVALLVGVLLVLPPTAIAATNPTGAGCGWDTSSGWVKRENTKVGDSTWANGIRMEYSGDYARKGADASISKWAPIYDGNGAVEGWFDQTSATCGQSVGLHISGNDKPVTIQLFRMGYYGGSGARLVETVKLPSVSKFSFPKFTRSPQSTVSTDWPVSWNLQVSSATPPGQYLVRLQDGGKDSNFVPLTINDPGIKSEITFISSVLTWQAYNQWGGYSLYKGPDNHRASRSVVVSFNRPYDGDGSGEFRYMEYPALKLAERLGIDLNYVTDVDLDRSAASLGSTMSIVMGGHGEYWTANMRAHIQAAVDNGINLVSLGANAIYARPRLQSNDRELIMWRGVPEDVNRNNPLLATSSWRHSPIAQPEAKLLGAQYVGLGVNADYTIPHPNRWPFTKMIKPELMQNIVGKEVDSPLYAVGPAVETLAESSIRFRGKDVKILATYYTNARHAGVIDMSTNGWVCAIDNVCAWHPFITPATQENARLITQEILSGLTKGPLGLWRTAMIDVPARTKIAPRQGI